MTEPGELGLPPLYRLRDFPGTLADYLRCVEWQYRAIVHEPGVRIWGRPVVAAGGRAPDGRDRRFWHLVTDSSGDGAEERRKLSLGRCALLGQVRHVLELTAAGDPRACWWREGSCIKIAPADFTFVVVLHERPSIFRLKTAYPTFDRRSREQQQERAAAAWLAGACRRDEFRHPQWRAGAPTRPRRPAAYEWDRLGPCLAWFKQQGDRRLDAARAVA